MEDKEKIILHLVKRLEEEIEECCEITCDRERCMDIIDELKRILSQDEEIPMEDYTSFLICIGIYDMDVYMDYTKGNKRGGLSMGPSV